MLCPYPCQLSLSALWNVHHPAVPYLALPGTNFSTDAVDTLRSCCR